VGQLLADSYRFVELSFGGFVFSRAEQRRAVLKQNRKVVFPASPPFFGLGGEKSRGKVPNIVTRSTARDYRLLWHLRPLIFNPNTIEDSNKVR